MSATAAAWTQFWNTVIPYFAYFTVALFSVGTLAVYNWGRTKGLQKQVDQQAKGNGTTVVSLPATPAPQAEARPLVAASIQCPTCGGQVHLDRLAPTPEQPTAAPPLDLP